VQRAVIALTEKGIDFEKKMIDLSNKPDWFLEVSPTGKVPIFQNEQGVVFESSVIVEYIEDTTEHPLHPGDPFLRAQHRSWMEFGSAILNSIGGLYNAPDKTTFEAKEVVLRKQLETLETAVSEGPYFAGESFSLVDAVFGPVFRYFDTFEQTANLTTLRGLPRIAKWRAALSNRPSIKNAVAPDYHDVLQAFLLKKDSHLAKLMMT
tara:strand:+ start:1111 stop:1731 length:621 start_codon:yes stop_codon:yes gene_type:complete